MYKVGDTILYGNSGACQIERLEMLRFSRKRERYYVLRPLHQNTAVIYVPAENSQLTARMRPIPNREEVEAMLQQAAQAESLWTEDVQERKSRFDEIIHGSDCQQKARLVLTLYQQKLRRQAEGKKLHVSDENYLREAQKLLCDAFADALERQPTEVQVYLTDWLKQSTGQ